MKMIANYAERIDSSLLKECHKEDLLNINKAVLGLMGMKKSCFDVSTNIYLCSYLAKLNNISDEYVRSLLHNCSPLVCMLLTETKSKIYSLIGSNVKDTIYTDVIEDQDFNNPKDPFVKSFYDVLDEAPENTIFEEAYELISTFADLNPIYPNIFHFLEDDVYTDKHMKIINQLISSFAAWIREIYPFKMHICVPEKYIEYANNMHRLIDKQETYFTHFINSINYEKISGNKSIIHTTTV